VTRRTQVATLFGVILAIYAGSQLRVGTDLTKFMPDRERSELAGVLAALADSPLSRTLAITIEAENLDEATHAARLLGDRLSNDPAIAWVRAGIEPAELEDLHELYFPRRLLFLSEDPEREIPERTSDPALRARARALRDRLATPEAPLLARLLPSDPLGAFEALLMRLREGQPALATHHGSLVSADLRFAIVIAETSGAAFDSGVQAPLLDSIEDFAKERGAAGKPITIELAAASRFAVEAERSMKRDIFVIASCASLGVALVFFCFVATLRSFLIVSLAPAVGIIAASAAGLFVFGSLDGLTMAFGASLMGIAIDYSNHLLVHQRLAPGNSAPRETARRLRPTLLLGALTTIASLAGLSATAFPAFREMGFFATVGVAAGLGVTLWVLPDLLANAPPLPRRAVRTAECLARALDLLSQRRRALLLIPLGLCAAGLAVLPRLEWSDEMSSLTLFAPELLAQDARVRARVDQLETGHLVVAIASRDVDAIERNDEIERRLRPAIASGDLAGTRSLHTLLWSSSLQRRNFAALSQDTTLPARLDAAFVAEGFRPGSFDAFADALKQPPPLLDLATLRAGPLANLAAPFWFELPDAVAVVTYLQGVRDLAAIEAELEGLAGVYVLDQRRFVDSVYREFRTTTLEQMIVGGLLVIVLLGLRYRAWRPVVAASLPSLIVAILLLASFALMGTKANLLQVMALIMVLGMGVDYGIFLVDTAGRRAESGATMLSLLLSCLTTALVFGTLALSSQPALRAIGVTTGLGIVLSYLLAPVALAVTGLVGDEAPDA
jgi:predicted exporter